MGNSNETQTVTSQTNAPSDEYSNTSSSQSFKNTYKHLLDKESEFNKARGLVSTSTIVEIFPGDLKHVGEEFAVTVTHQILDASYIKHDSAENIGDSSVITPETSQFSQTPDGSADSFVRNAPKEGEEKQSDMSLVNEHQFVAACNDVFMMDDTLKKTRYYICLSSKAHPSLLLKDCESVLRTCCKAAMLLVNRQFTPTGNDEHMISLIAKDMYPGSGSPLSDKGLHEWMSSNKVFLFDALHCWLLDTLQNYEPDQIADQPDTVGVARQRLVCDTLHWLLCMTLPVSFFTTRTTESLTQLSQTQKNLAVIERWELLYDSDQHGLSINRFEHHVVSYKAPSILLVTTATSLFYVSCSTEWRKGLGRFGGDDCRYVRILPNIKTTEGSNLLNWIDKPRDPLRGILVDNTGTRSYIALIFHDFSSIRCNGVDCDIKRMQVFGCGDESAREEQLKQKQWQRKQVQKIQDQKLHLEPNWDENADKKILEMAGIKTNNVQR